MVGCLVGFLLIGAALANQYYASPKSTSQNNQSRSKQHKKEWQNSNQFHAHLLKIANDYKENYGLVDPNANWVPLPCAGLRVGVPISSTTLVSNSDDKKTHGQKLYLLFAAKKNYYNHSKKHVSPLGQAIVKESWEAIETEPQEKKSVVDFEKFEKMVASMATKHASGHRVIMSARKDKKFYHAGKQKELFIMYKVDPKTKGTDKGWVYGTVSADGKTVTAAGTIQSCMKCHKEAGVDRLFGPKNPPPDKWYEDFDNIPEGDSPSRSL